MKRILLLVLTFLMLVTGMAFAEEYQTIRLVAADRITYTIPKGMVLSSVNRSDGKLEITIDANATHWDQVLMDTYDPTSGLINIRVGYKAPLNAKKGLNTNFSFDDHNEQELLNQYELECLMQQPQERDSVSNGATVARYDEDSMLLQPTPRDGEAILAGWYTDDGQEIFKELLVTYVRYTSLSPIIESLPKIPASRLVAGFDRTEEEGTAFTRYEQAKVSPSVSNGFICYEVPDPAQLPRNTIYSAVLAPEGGIKCRYRYADFGTGYEEALVLSAGSSIAGTTYDVPAAMIPVYVHSNNSINTATRNIEWLDSNNNIIEVARLTLQTVSGDPQPWPFYIMDEWTPIPATRLDLSSLEAENITVSMLSDGWLHIAPVEGALPDPQKILSKTFTPVVTSPDPRAVYYRTNTGGGNDIFGQHHAEHQKLDQETVVHAKSPVNITSAGATLDAVPPIVEMPVNPDSNLIVYFSPEMPGEHAGGILPIFWYDENDACIAKEFLVVTRDPIVITDEREVTAQHPSSRVEMPVLVVNHGSNRIGCKLIIERYPARGGFSDYYELYLINEAGERIQPDGMCDLYLPFPETDEEIEEKDFVIHHYDSGHRIVESFRFGDEHHPITRTEWGMCIRVSHLSPFELTWGSDSSNPPSDDNCDHELFYEEHGIELVERCAKCRHFSVLIIETNDFFTPGEEIHTELFMDGDPWFGKNMDGALPEIFFLDKDGNCMDSKPSELGEYAAAIEVDGVRAVRPFEIVDELPPSENDCMHEPFYFSDGNLMFETCNCGEHFCVMAIEMQDVFLEGENIVVDLTVYEGDWLGENMDGYPPEIFFTDDRDVPINAVPSKPGTYRAAIRVGGETAFYCFVIEAVPVQPTTGDNSMLLLWLAAMSLSCCALLVLRRRVRN